MSGVDVVIVTHGGAADLAECARGLRAQGSAVGRVILIDNASPDATVSAARELQDVEVIANRENRGYAAAMNQGLAITSAEFLLSLNADCVLGAGYVEACVAALAAEPNAAAATGLLVLPDGRVDSTGFTVSSAFWAAERDRHRCPDQVVRHDPPFGVSGAAAVWRRRALDDLGPDPWWDALFVYWDDVELCWRARRRGWTFSFVPDGRATHRRGADTAVPDFIEAQSFRNRLATLARHRGLRGLLAPAPLAVTGVVAVRLALRHPAALRAAHPFDAVRAGITARRRDPQDPAPELSFARHEWRPWLAAQLRRARSPVS